MQYLAVAAVLISASLAAAQLTVNTPASLVVCQPSALSWSGGTAPYFPSIIPGGQPSAAALESFPQTSATTLTWTVDITTGTSITLQVRDSTGTINYSDQVTIQAGTSTSCVGKGSGSASAGSSSVSATGAAGSTSGAGSTATSTGRGVSSGTAAGTTATGSSSRGSTTTASSTASGTAGASSPSASTNGAEKVGAGIFTLAAAAVVALFA